jgi:hypothetical protein
MNKEFIPYTEALALKELGFDEPCLGLFHNDKSFYSTQCKSHKQYHGQVCSAPLYQQAFRWFREKYGYYYQIGNSGDNTKFLMLRNSEMSIVWNDKGFNTYEEAELACLIKLIEIVKNK